MSGKKPSQADAHLREALLSAYSARAKLFHSGMGKSGLRGLFGEVDRLPSSELDWVAARTIGISPEALTKVKSGGIALHQLFAHPLLLKRRPQLVAYYRNLVAISKKGMSQPGLSTERFERERPAKMGEEEAMSLALTFNSVLSKVIESLPDVVLSNGRDVAFAEIGTELQGTWANTIGKGAAKAVERILAEHVVRQGCGRMEKKGLFALNNGWTIRFGSEPDVSFTDPHRTERIAIEIKGSLDRAGAQTRYGEARAFFISLVAIF